MPEWSSDYGDQNPDTDSDQYSTEEEDSDYETDVEHSDLLYRNDPYFDESETVPDPSIDTQTDPTDLTYLIAEDSLYCDQIRSRGFVDRSIPFEPILRPDSDRGIHVELPQIIHISPTPFRFFSLFFGAQVLN